MSTVVADEMEDSRTAAVNRLPTKSASSQNILVADQAQQKEYKSRPLELASDTESSGSTHTPSRTAGYSETATKRPISRTKATARATDTEQFTRIALGDREQISACIVPEDGLWIFDALQDNEWKFAPAPPKKAKQPVPYEVALEAQAELVTERPDEALIGEQPKYAVLGLEQPNGLQNLENLHSGNTSDAAPSPSSKSPLEPAVNSAKGVMLSDLDITCYNCAASMHYGDDCPSRPQAVKGVFSAEYAQQFCTEQIPVPKSAPIRGIPPSGPRQPPLKKLKR